MMVVTRNSKVSGREVHLITGGGGFAGFWLGKRLAGNGHHVILVDIATPKWTLEDNMEFKQVNSLL